MSRLFEAANRYIATSDWKIIAVLKFCLISLGMMIGMQIKPAHKSRSSSARWAFSAPPMFPLWSSSIGYLPIKKHKRTKAVVGFPGAASEEAIK